jgi:hypothetical protein
MSEDAPELGAGQGPSDPLAALHVFVSYASQDIAVANAVVEALERHGLACWIAPRDVTPGAVYADAIVRAISGAHTVVMVLSENAIASPHVGKESSEPPRSGDRSSHCESTPRLCHQQWNTS